MKHIQLGAKEQKLQRHRLRMTSLSILNAFLESMIIGLYAWAGTVPWPIAITFWATSISTAIAFTLVIASDWNLRFKDRDLLRPQLVVAVATQLIFLVLVPKLWVVFLVSILVFYNFAMMGFSTRQFAKTWLACGVLTALALYFARDRFGYPGTSNTDIAILWLFFFLAIGCLTVIGVQISRLREQLSEKNRQLRVALERNQQLASHDDLTGVYNRRVFMQQLAEERGRASRQGQQFCVAIFDLDDFKAVNDRFGHQAGDAVLRKFCGIVQLSMRSTDRFARYGGEEFVLMLTATALPEAAVAVERIRLAVEQNDWDAIMPGLRVTVSAGVAAFEQSESTEDLLGRADRALYGAKDAGRNCIAIA